MSLTPEEIKFFETGDASHLTAGAPAPAPAPDAAPDPLELAALGNAPAPAPAPAPAEPPAVPPAPAPAPAPDATEILRQSLQEAQRQVAELQAAQKTQPPAPAPADPGPDATVDPVGALLHQIKGVQEQIKAIQEAQAQTTEQSTQMQRFQAFQQQVLGLRAEFEKTHADFNDAYQHLRTVRASDLAEFGMTKDQINQTLFQEEVALSEKAIREARNPAEVAYEMAKRHGYTPKAAAPAPAPAPAGPDAAAIARAQSASRQLPAAAPAGGDTELTLDGLRQASDADINKLVLNDASWKKLTGADQYPL